MRGDVGELFDEAARYVTMRGESLVRKGDGLVRGCVCVFA